jgi:uncharacterized membrane protein
MDIRHFLTYHEKKLISEHIRIAESLTSGEIRVHIAQTCSEDIVQDALSCFYKIGMHYTAQSNGVLLYICPKEHKVIVMGDTGINDQVGEQYWNDVIAIIVRHFKDRKYLLGITKAIDKIGDKLASLFPPIHNDINELSNEVTFSD